VVIPTTLSRAERTENRRERRSDRSRSTTDLSCIAIVQDPLAVQAILAHSGASAPPGPAPRRGRRTHVARGSVPLSTLPLTPPVHPAPQPHPSARFLTASLLMAQDGSG
jgi:hypothetical protein